MLYANSLCGHSADTYIAGLGNAIGLLHNIQLGALQYQAAIAQIIDGGSIEQSSLSDVHTQIKKQRFAGILLFRYCIEGRSCAVAVTYMYVLLWRHATKHLVPKLLVESSHCLVCSLQRCCPEMLPVVDEFYAYCAECALPSVMTEAHRTIFQQDCQHLGQVMPAAILTAAEKAAEAKEQAIRGCHQLPDEAQIFADGFAIGLAFLLQVGTSPALMVMTSKTQLLQLTSSNMLNTAKMHMSCMYSMSI